MSKEIILIVMLLLVGQVMAYPTLVSYENHNHETFKQFISKIPDKYLKHVAWIEMQSNKVECDNENAIVCFDTGNYLGYTTLKLKYGGGCFGKAVIYSYNYKTIYHELGHIYDFCELKNTLDRTYEEKEMAADNYGRLIMR